jgi:hypothetical protein
VKVMKAIANYDLDMQVVELPSESTVTWGLTARIAEPEKQPLLGNETAGNNGGTVGGGVFCAVRAKTIGRPSEQAHLVCSDGMRLAWDGHQPARTWARKKVNVCHYVQQNDWEHWPVCGGYLQDRCQPANMEAEEPMPGSA